MQNMYDEKGVKMNKLLKYTFMLLCCFLLMGCLPLDKETDKKSIVCTTYAQYNWLQEIIGENNSTFELTLLIKDGADLHSYQPTIQDLAKVSSADLFVYVGGESEQWVSDALKEAKNKNNASALNCYKKVSFFLKTLLCDKNRLTIDNKNRKRFETSSFFSDKGRRNIEKRSWQSVVFTDAPRGKKINKDKLCMKYK